MKKVQTLLWALLFLPAFANAQPQAPTKQTTVTAAHATNANGPVRGVTYQQFRSTITFKDTSKSADTINAATTRIAWMLWKAEKWNDLFMFFTAVVPDSINGGWPPNNGAVWVQNVTLQVGLLVDRYGSNYGYFVSPKGTPFGMRALPPSAINSPYNVYKVTKPIPGVQKGQIIPWFGEPGLGIQYKLPYNINDLLAQGYIVTVPQNK